jgi:hypothetical protein
VAFLGVLGAASQVAVLYHMCTRGMVQVQGGTQHLKFKMNKLELNEKYQDRAGLEFEAPRAPKAPKLKDRKSVV